MCTELPLSNNTNQVQGQLKVCSYDTTFKVEATVL